MTPEEEVLKNIRNFVETSIAAGETMKITALHGNNAMLFTAGTTTTDTAFLLMEILEGKKVESIKEYVGKLKADMEKRGAETL